VKNSFITLLACAIVTLSCGDKNRFIKDPSYSKEVKEQFENRKAELSQKNSELFDIFTTAGMKPEEREAMEFLYAYMSLNDIADYDGEFFYNEIKASFAARNMFTWGKKVPDDLFRHFVLPPRVNNENLDTARMVFLQELKGRVKDMNMYDAALEVNHWCHEKITYRPSDSRTSSPLASILTGYGRCGEESTLTVTALRSVGIPARQCYTPRWAHTDDNHAWVEVWCDGKWYYMGACEPEPELNMAWFTEPAKRAMMVHTNVFGRYYGKESKTDFPLYTKINVLENYTSVRKLGVTVLDGNNNKVAGAEVKYLLYNYADYYPIFDNKSDTEGHSEIISGLGDLLIWASKDGKYGYKKVSLADTDSVAIVLDRIPGEEYEELMEITPPKNLAGYMKEKSPGVAANKRRLKYEDSLRTVYLSTFMKREDSHKLANKLGLDTARVAGFIFKSEGNYKEIADFIEHNSKNPKALQILSTLSDKDLRDTPANILQSHIDNTIDYAVSLGYDQSVYTEGILSPVVSKELIRDWRPLLRDSLKKIFPAETGFNEIKEWVINNITQDNEQNYSGCSISPAGVLKIKRADIKSMNIFYVALCRSFNIPSRMDPATSQVQVYEKGKWVTVNLVPASVTKEKGTLVINYNSDNNSPIPQYWSYYTLSKYENGSFVALDYENDPRVAKFPVTLSLDNGYYRLTAGNRYADGRVVARNVFFNLSGGGKTSRTLNIPQLFRDSVVYGKAGAVLDRELYKDGGLVICFIEPEKEPTKHVMNEMPIHKIAFDKWGGNFLFVVPENNLRKDFNPQIYSKLPAKTQFVTKNGSVLMDAMLKSANQSFRDNYPLIYIVNKKGEIIFHSEGYRIGIGDLLSKSL
jgi:transglutaminase-like putative cysteine protease